MKKVQTTSIVLLAGALGLATLPASAQRLGGSAWAGPYIGGQIGINDSSASGLGSASALSGGATLGYNLAVPAGGLQSPLILGGNFFAEFNGQATHNHGVSYGSNVYGMDFLAGYPLGATREFMPYVKVGFGQLNATGDLGGDETSARVGVGAELHLRSRLGLYGQWMHQDAANISNDNFTVGVNYHFGRF